MIPYHVHSIFVGAFIFSKNRVQESFIADYRVQHFDNSQSTDHIINSFLDHQAVEWI